MSKYIIDLRPDCKVVQQICASDENVNVGVRSIGLLDELTDDYVKKNFKDLLEGEYQRGLEEGKAQAERGCKGCEYEGKTGEHLPCDYCMNNFKNQWTAKKEEIGVGDVVETKSGTIFAVTKITTDGFAVGFNGDGNTCCFDITKLTKTGKHYNINEILGWLSDD